MSYPIYDGPTCGNPLPFVRATECNMPLDHASRCSFIYGKMQLTMKTGEIVIAIGAAIPFGTDPLPPIVTDR